MSDLCFVIAEAAGDCVVLYQVCGDDDFVLMKRKYLIGFVVLFALSVKRVLLC